jgi:hypothetical protein
MAMSWSKLLQTRLQNWHFIAMMFVIHQIGCDMDSLCSDGLEYHCKTLQGNGTACVLGCNLTVTQILSPGE